jgi:hypothetical protein
MGAYEQAMRVTYELPNTRVFSKFYNRDTAFDAVDWSAWLPVVDGFHRRFSGWYFEPLEEFPRDGHEAYPVLCAMCALVDAFTHYDRDDDWHSPKEYKQFLRHMNPIFSKSLSCPIVSSRRVRGDWQEQIFKDFSDVFYVGVRCSLHHHGDLEPFAGMSGTGVLAQEFPNAGRSTCGMHSYPVVVFDPWVFRDELRAWFDTYCDDLRNHPGSTRAHRFRDRFRGDFGISISEGQ